MFPRTSPLRVEINPWATDATIEEVMQLRGAYISALGTIETILTELAIRASKHEAYVSVRTKFPSRRPDRLKYLEALREIEGPLTPYRGLIAGTIKRFRAGLGARDILAHGRMQVMSGPGDDASIKLEDYSAAGAYVSFRRDQWTLKNFRIRTYRATRLSRCVVMLYARLGDRLPRIEGAYQGTTPIP